MIGRMSACAGAFEECFDVSPRAPYRTTDLDVSEPARLPLFPERAFADAEPRGGFMPFQEGGGVAHPSRPPPEHEAVADAKAFSDRRVIGSQPVVIFRFHARN